MNVSPAIYLCFRWGSPKRRVLAATMDAVEPLIEPTHIRVHGTRKRPRYSRARFDAAISDPDLSSLHVPGRAGEFLTSEFHRQGFWQVFVNLPGWPTNLDWLDAVMQQPGFTAALLGDNRDKVDQSETAVANYRAFGPSLEGVRLTKNDYGEDIVDVSQHWGRARVGPGMWFWAAARMWFGPSVFEIIDRAQLVALGDEASVLPDGVVRVDLFDPSWPIGQVRERQRRFREQMNYDRLEASEPDGIVNPSDPMVEIFQREGSQDVECVIEWLDDDRNPARRSVATKKRVAQFAASGRPQIRIVDLGDDS